LNNSLVFQESGCADTSWLHWPAEADCGFDGLLCDGLVVASFWWWGVGRCLCGSCYTSMEKLLQPLFHPCEKKL